MLGIFKTGRLKPRKFLKLSFVFLILNLILIFILKIILQNPTVIRNNIEQSATIPIPVSHTNSWDEKIKSTLRFILLNNEIDGKLITLFVTFVDVSAENIDNSESYRRLAQMNFLQSSNFPELKAKMNFVIYTRCPYWLEIIGAKYSHIHTLPEIIRAPFQVPLLKDLTLEVLERFNTPFYMYANADNIYGTTLIQTVVAILNAMQLGVLRSKLLVIGHRFNVVPDRIIKDEIEVTELKKIAQQNKPFAKDYTIFTRDSFDWTAFPDLMIGRQFLDSYMTDYAFHNEIEVIDATATISLVHQVFKLGYSTDITHTP